MNVLIQRLTNKMEYFDFHTQKIEGFFIVLEGKVQLKTPKDWYTRILTTGDYFGENLLVNVLGI